MSRSGYFSRFFFAHSMHCVSSYVDIIRPNLLRHIIVDVSQVHVFPRFASEMVQELAVMSCSLPVALACVVSQLSVWKRSRPAADMFLVVFS